MKVSDFENVLAALDCELKFEILDKNTKESVIKG